MLHFRQLSAAATCARQRVGAGAGAGAGAVRYEGRLAKSSGGRVSGQRKAKTAKTEVAFANSALQ